jgi:hypothetical protein
MVVAAAVTVFVLNHGLRVQSGASTASGDIPPGAQVPIRLLVSAHGRQALTPELNAFLPKGKLFPAGTTFTARPGSWHQAGGYANVSGVLRVPGKSPVNAEIGLVKRTGHWLVTFEAHQ